MKKLFFSVLILGFLISCAQNTNESIKTKAVTGNDSLVSDTFVYQILLPEKDYRSIHVFVALCDNEHQGILPVPEKIGNGKDPKNNLYWGCGYGVKTYFLKKSPDWKLIKSVKPKEDYILERLLFKHKDSAVYLVADAIDGEQIEQANINMLLSLSGNLLDTIFYEGKYLQFGGQADLIAYTGHDYIMDYEIDIDLKPADTIKRNAIILACASANYYAPYVQKTGAHPLLWTTNLMAPEAYSLEAAIAGWILHESGKAIEARAARSYSDHHSRCSFNAAMNLFKTGW